MIERFANAATVASIGVVEDGDAILRDAARG
jgi:hypothetical protein